MSEFKAMFLELVKGHANSNSFPFAVEFDGKLSVQTLAIPPGRALDKIRSQIIRQAPQAWGVAFDRWAYPDQGTTRASVMTWLIVVGGERHVGVIEYDETEEGLDMDPPREDCPYWCKRMSTVADFCTGVISGEGVEF